MVGAYFRACAARVGAGVVIVLASTPALSQPAWAPGRAVEISANCAPGCGPDRTARTLQRIWQERGVPVVIS